MPAFGLLHLVLAAAAMTAVAASGARASGPVCGPTGDDPDPDPCAGYGLTSRMDYEPSALPEPVSLDYSQSHFEPHDIVGDYSLARAAASTPSRIVWTVTGRRFLVDRAQDRRAKAQACADAIFEGQPRATIAYGAAEAFVPRAQDLRQIDELATSNERKADLRGRLERGEIALEGHKNPFDVARMKEMFREIIAEESAAGVPPSRSQPGDWSPEFLARAPLLERPFTLAPKILVALSRGETDQYFRTDTQVALHDWVLSQGQGQVTIDALFRKSYVLNGGDLYLALLTIENVIARYWLTPQRESLALTERLADITNYFGRRDNRFGTWYHFFGIMLYGLVRPAAEAEIVGFTERVGSRIMRHGPNLDASQESFANLTGGLVGRYLRVLSDKAGRGEVTLEPGDRGVTLPSYYLDLGEDFSAQLLDL